MELQESNRDYRSREGFVPAIQRPARRPLKVFAFDPSLRRSSGNLTVVEVANEQLRPGPEGRLVRVVDYDATEDCYCAPVDLDAAAVLIQRGLYPSDSDPRFHQQVVSAAAMKVIENFERALGWPFRFRGGRKLAILAHAFEDSWRQPGARGRAWPGRGAGQLVARAGAGWLVRVADDADPHRAWHADR